MEVYITGGQALWHDKDIPATGIVNLATWEFTQQ